MIKKKILLKSPKVVQLEEEYKKLADNLSAARYLYFMFSDERDSGYDVDFQCKILNFLDSATRELKAKLVLLLTKLEQEGVQAKDLPSTSVTRASTKVDCLNSLGVASSLIFGLSAAELDSDLLVQ